MAKTRKPRLDPETEWSNDGGDKDEGLELCDRILEKLEDAPDHAWDKAYDFFESVETKVKGIRETIEKTGSMTLRQKEAMENMESGVDKWIR